MNLFFGVLLLLVPIASFIYDWIDLGSAKRAFREISWGLTIISFIFSFLNFAIFFTVIKENYDIVNIEKYNDQESVYFLGTGCGSTDPSYHIYYKDGKKIKCLNKDADDVDVYITKGKEKYTYNSDREKPYRIYIHQNTFDKIKK